MDLEVNHAFHIYNQGNNRVPIFFEEENYLFFIKKMRTHLFPYCHIMAYALMPNHFHWLIYINRRKSGDQKIPARKSIAHLKNNIATLLSSYTRAVNKRYRRSGSLFRQSTKAVKIDSNAYALTCFHYIHQNPAKAHLVSTLGEWPYSSFPDYACLRDGTLISKRFTLDFLGLSGDSFLEGSEYSLNPEIVGKLFC